MVFSSFPVYLDHTTLHQFQQPDHQQGNGVQNFQVPPPPLPPSVGCAGGGGGVAGSIRPGSMVDRARLAKIPLPEAGLKCPRCDSTNTKFCYFNNYSLSQPRHFCKMCRRYWTRGGALRNVPVGGGCRRNKRSKSGNSSKSGGSTEKQMATNHTTPTPYSSSRTEMAGHFSESSAQLPIMASSQNFNDYGGVNLGSNIGGFQTQILPRSGNGVLTELWFNVDFGGHNNNLSADQWKLPSLGGFEPSTHIFPFQSEGVETSSSSMIGDLQLPSMATSPARVSQLASSDKMEDNKELNLSKQFLGTSDNNQQHWAANTWTRGFPGLNSSSTNHLS